MMLCLKHASTCHTLQLAMHFCLQYTFSCHTLPYAVIFLHLPWPIIPNECEVIATNQVLKNMASMLNDPMGRLGSLTSNHALRMHSRYMRVPKLHNPQGLAKVNCLYSLIYLVTS
jgi:hypothetical protein